MEKEGIESRFVQGLRVTCERSIAVVEQVIKGEVNPAIVASLRRKGAKAEAVHGDTILRVTRKTGKDEAGGALDWGFVGVPHEVDTAPLESLLAQATIPVITPLGMGPDGRVHNVNADVAAAAVAQALKARKLVFLSDVEGVLADEGDPDSVLSTLHAKDVEQLIAKGVIKGGMVPKVLSCVEAIHAGVRKVHMIDGRMPHSLLLEIFTDKGVGTEIIRDED